MLFKNFKSLKKCNFYGKNDLLFLENQELFSENASLKQELTLKNNILKNIILEHKNHITVLIGFSDLLLDQRQNILSEKQKQYVSNIRKTAVLLDIKIELVKLSF